MLEERPRLSPIFLILIILLSGFALRAGLLQATAEIPVAFDEGGYYRLGSKLIENFESGLRRGNFLWRPPLFPFLLAGVRIIIGPEPYHAKWVQIFLGTTIVALGYSLARRLFDQRSGLAAAIFLGLYPELIVYSTLLFTETLFITLNIASFLLLVHYQAHPRPLTLLLAGIVWALTILTRDQAFLFTPIIALWLAWYSKGGARQRILPAASFLLVVLLGLSPWIARNLWATGSFAFVTQHTGFELFKSSGNRDPQLDREAWCAKYRSLIPDREAQEKFAFESSLDYILRDPARWASDKIARFWQRFSGVNLEAFRRIERDIYGTVLPRYTFPLLLVTTLGFLLLNIGWIVGLVSAPSSAGRNLLLLWLGYTGAVYIVFRLFLRLRTILLVSLTLFAGYFWGQPLLALHKIRGQPIAFVLAAVLITLLLANLNIYILPLSTKTCIGSVYF